MEVVEYGAEEETIKRNGGLTVIGDVLYSNYCKDDYIRINRAELNCIRLYIPTTTNVNEKADREQIQEVIRQYSYYMNECFGAYPVLKSAYGSWYSEDLKEIVRERILILEVNTVLNSRYESLMKIQRVVNVARRLRDEMSQECVSVQVNDSLLLV
jgi:hypothetical protein